MSFFTRCVTQNFVYEDERSGHIEAGRAYIGK